MRPKKIGEIMAKARKRLDGFDTRDPASLLDAPAMVWLSAYDLSELLDRIESLEDEIRY